MQIPEGWEEYDLRSILKYEQPYKYSVNSTNYNKNGIPVLTAGKSFILGYTAEKEGIYNNLPVVIFDDFTTDSKFVDFPFKVKSSAMKFLKEKEEGKISLKLLFEIISQLKYYSIGGDHKRRWISDFSKKKVLLPKSLTEQKKIAEILSKVDTAIEQTQSLITKYQRIKTGLMQDLLTKGIDENGNIRSEETHEFKDSELGRIPKEWEVAELFKITTEDICYGIVQVGKHINNGIPTIAIKDLNTDYQNVHLTSLEIESTYKRSRVVNGDLLISIKATTDKIDIVPETFIGNISRDIAKIRFDEECNSRFYKNYFLSPFGKQTLSLITVGSTRKEISIAPLKRIKVIKPPLKEQNRIVLSLIELDSKIRYDHLNMNKLQSLKTGLMQDLLSGKKRVSSLIMNGKL